MLLYFLVPIGVAIISYIIYYVKYRIYIRDKREALCDRISETLLNLCNSKTECIRHYGQALWARSLLQHSKDINVDTMVTQRLMFVNNLSESNLLFTNNRTVLYFCNIKAKRFFTKETAEKLESITQGFLNAFDYEELFNREEFIKLAKEKESATGESDMIVVANIEKSIYDFTELITNKHIVPFINDLYEEIDRNHTLRYKFLNLLLKISNFILGFLRRILFLGKK